MNACRYLEIDLQETKNNMGSFEIKNILIPVDFSGTGEKVLEQAAFMSKRTNATITLVHIIEDSSEGPDYNGIPLIKDGSSPKECGEKNMASLKKRLFDTGVNKIECIIEAGVPNKKILEIAKRIKTDIIVMGTHGVSGFKEFVMGSHAFKVASEARCPVLTIQRHTTQQGFKNILVPFCDKPHSREKVDYAISIAKIYNATMHVVGISYDNDAAEINKLNLEAEQIMNMAKQRGVKCTEEVIKDDYNESSILTHAKEKNADLLILMADLDRLGLSQVVMGPVIKRLINHSTIPVLSIHPSYNPHPVVDAPVSVSDWTFWI
jgi:nucleotide-binding universal stress UspA family protein